MRSYAQVYPQDRCLQSHLIHKDIGKKLYVPRINSSPGHDHMDFLQIENKEDLGSLQGGTWGIKEPGLEKNGVKRINGSYLSALGQN